MPFLRVKTNMFHAAASNLPLRCIRISDQLFGSEPEDEPPAGALQKWGFYTPSYIYIHIYIYMFSTNHLYNYWATKFWSIYITIGLPNFDLYIWLVVYQPLWKMMEWVTVGIVKFPTEWKNRKFMFQTTNQLYMFKVLTIYTSIGLPNFHLYSKIDFFRGTNQA